MEEYKRYTIELILGPDFQGMYSAFIPGDKERTLIETNWFNIENESEKENAHEEIKCMIDTCLGSKVTHDELLAELAQLIIGAYNGSYKPPIIHAENPMYVRHSLKGYSCIVTEGGENIISTDESINEFVERVFLILAGNTEVKWNRVCTSDAVKHALNKHFGMEVELSNVGYAHKFDVFGIPTLPIKPTIWAKRVADDAAFKEMEDKGFTYFERDLWEITL